LRDEIVSVAASWWSEEAQNTLKEVAEKLRNKAVKA